MANGRWQDKRGGKRAALKRSLRKLSSRVGFSVNAPSSGTTTVQFLDSDGNEIGTTTVAVGSTILSVAAKQRIDIDHFCGGQCSCGTCRINVVNGETNLSKMTGMEEMVLGAKHTAAGCRLACQACVVGPVTIQVPRWF